MALYNEILAGRYNRFLQKLFGIKGEAPSPQLSGEVMPVFPLFSGVENRYLESWQRFAIQVATGTPAAGNRAAIRIRMPSNTTVVAVLERVQVLETQANDLAIFDYNAVATAMPTEDVPAITVKQIDVRAGQVGANAVVSTSVNFGLAPATFIAQAFVGLNTQYDFIPPDDVSGMVMAPGSQFTLVSNTLVQRFQANLIWRERALEESERT